MVTHVEKPPSDRMLKHFRAVVVETYGDRLERVTLLGSRGRGDALPDSDAQCSTSKSKRGIMP